MTHWQDLVQSGDLVFQIGAGAAAADCERLQNLRDRGARLICVEPHPDRARELRQLFGTGPGAGVTVVDMGLSNRTGVVPTSAPGIAIQVTTLDEMLRAFGVPHYCRIDVGGDAEAVLCGLTLSDVPSIPLLSFEFKAALGGSLRRALERLELLGYRSFNVRVGASTDLALAEWTDARGVLERIARDPDTESRGDVFARRESAAARFAVSILQQPGNIHSECFREVAQTVHAGLLALGQRAVISDRTDVAGSTNIVFGSNLIANLDAPQRFAPGSILYNLEQIYDGSPWLTPGLLAAFREHTVWDYSLDNIRALARHGVTARHAPVGYVPQLTRIAPAPQQDIDVLFIGSIADRRLKVLHGLQERGAKVVAVYGLYGRERDALIARSKIVLNVHFHAAKVFEIVRVSYLLANRCFVVSEAGSGSADERSLAHGVAFAEYDRLVDTCMDYLADAEARQAIARRGFEIMASRLEPDLLRPLLASCLAS